MWNYVTLFYLSVFLASHHLFLDCDENTAMVRVTPLRWHFQTERASEKYMVEENEKIILIVLSSQKINRSNELRPEFTNWWKNSPNEYFYWNSRNSFPVSDFVQSIRISAIILYFLHWNHRTQWIGYNGP